MATLWLKFFGVGIDILEIGDIMRVVENYGRLQNEGRRTKDFGQAVQRLGW